MTEAEYSKIIKDTYELFDIPIDDEKIKERWESKGGCYENLPAKQYEKILIKAFAKEEMKRMKSGR